MSEETTLLSLLVVNIDYKLQQWKQPYPTLSSSVVNPRERKQVYVPVIRIFGSTDSGQRCCAHIHGVLPYVYFRPENLQHAAFDTEAKVRSLMNGLEAALEDLLFNYKSTTWKTAAPRQNRSQYSKRKRIHSLETVRKKTIYGMHMESFMFIKVVLYDPNDIRRVAAVLEEGAIRGISMQSYESHIPYLLQFTSDYNVQPMGWMHLRSAKFRLPLPADPVLTIHNELQAITVPAIPSTNPPTTTATNTQDSASVDPTNGLFNSPIKGVHSLTMGGTNGTATVDSPMFSCGGVASSGYTDISNQPVREDSTISYDSLDGKRTHKPKLTAVEPHIYLTQHQLSHYVNTSEEINSTNSADQNNNMLLTQGAKKAKLLTQSSIPAHLVWSNDEAHDINTNLSIEDVVEPPLLIDQPTTVTSSVYTSITLSASEQAEVDRLLCGITAEDMRWSQDNIAHANTTSAQASCTTATIVASAPAANTNLIDKESTCELEIDIHHSCILNTAHPRVAFGAELWAEEKARCAEKGLSMDTIITPPSTQTVYREPQPTELNFRNRFENLKLKGLALRAASREKLNNNHTISSNSGSGGNSVVPALVLPEPSSRLAGAPYGIGNTATATEEADLVDAVDIPLLTQAAILAPPSALHTTTISNPLPSQLPPLSQHTPPLSSLPLPISQWAQERIHEATQQAHIDISTQQHYLNPDSFAEEYFKSQISAHEVDRDDNIVAARGVQQNENDEEEESEETVSQEMCDILMSTQINLDNMHELSNNNNNSSRHNNSSSSRGYAQNTSELSKQSHDLSYTYSPILTKSPTIPAPIPTPTPPESDNIFSEAFMQQAATTMDSHSRVLGSGEKLMETTLLRQGSLVRTQSAQRPPLHPSTNSNSGTKRVASTPTTITIDNPFYSASLSRSSSTESIDRANSIDTNDSRESRESGNRTSPLTQHTPDYNSGNNDNLSIHSPVSHLLQHSCTTGSDSPLLVPFIDSTTASIPTVSAATSSATKISKFTDPYGTLLKERDSLIFPSGWCANSSDSSSSASVDIPISGSKVSNCAGGTGTKSISSVFRKRKHSAVSFALFPDKTPASTNSSPLHTNHDTKDTTIENPSVTFIAAATPTSSGKKVKRSVSFRETEEICAPPVYSDPSQRTSTTKKSRLNGIGSATSSTDYTVPVRQPLAFSTTAKPAPIPVVKGYGTDSSSSSSNKHSLRCIRSVYSNTPLLPSPPILPSSLLTPYTTASLNDITMEAYSVGDSISIHTSQSPVVTAIPHPSTAPVQPVPSPVVITAPIAQNTINQTQIKPVLPVLLQLPLTLPLPLFGSKHITLYPTFTPPTFSSLTNITSYGLPPMVNPPAHYSNKDDAQLSNSTTGNAYLTDLRKLKHLHDLPAFDGGFPTNDTIIPVSTTNRPKLENRVRCLVPTFLPPHPKLFKQTNANTTNTTDKRLKQRYDSIRVDDTSQIATPTQTPYTHAEPIPVRKNATTEPNVNTTSPTSVRKHRLTTLSIEIHCSTRQDFLPNPKYDAVQCVIYVVDDCIGNSDSESVKRVSGVICVLQEDKNNSNNNATNNSTCDTATTSSGNDNTNSSGISTNLAADTITTTITAETARQAQQRALLASCALPASTYIDIVPTEQLLFTKLITIVRTIDPDFIVGYNIENKSIGYLIKRAYLYEINLVMELSRVPEERGSYRNGPMPVFKNGNTNKSNGSNPTNNNTNTTTEPPTNSNNNNNDQTEDENPIYEPTDNIDKSEISSEIVLTGRIVLNVWRLMREEVKLFNYTYNNVAAHVMNVRVPYFTHAHLTKWFINPLTRYKTIRYIHLLTTLNLQLLETVDHIRKTSECARLYHIDYNSVITRGSQYRVEASLLHKAHTNDYLLISPTRRAVASQAPMEVIPLVLEPQSTLYTDPVVVLDFQSLYPSMMLAYNLCYSTIMGKMRNGEGGDGNYTSDNNSSGGRSSNAGEEPANATSASTYAYKESDTTERLGASSYPESISALNATLHTNTTNNNNNTTTTTYTTTCNDANTHYTPYVAPNGSVFCHKNTRLGILPQMVQEMLTTRVMVKRAMKRHAKPSNTGGMTGSRDVLQKVMDARQLAIKLLSNVTYGYTSAGFSGRMPMAELADAIVQSGRSTLEWTIREIQSHPDWKAKVVYGDTDSVFVKLEGRSKEEAFRIGQEISDFITARSPAEVILKFEKVYLPCVLVTKKRYVGNMYESITQVVPHFEAKGIEVVRRDQCPAVVKMQEKALRVLFASFDMSQVKSYIVNEWSKMMQGGDKLLLRDFIFSKEVRYGQYASVSSQPPGAVVACKAVLHDEMAVPPYNWRVPYVVVCGVPNAQLRNLVCSPEEVLRRGSELRLNYVYYMTKCINPALDRVLSLCGGEVFTWFKSISRPKLRLRHINYDTYDDTSGSNSGSSGNSDSRSITLFANSTNNKKRHKQTSMNQYTTQGTCEICSNDALPMKTLCHTCTTSPLTTLTTLFSKLHVYTHKEQTLSKVCHNCAKYAQPSILYAKNEVIGPDTCESLDCQVMYERARLVTKIEDCQVSLGEIEDL